MPETACLHIQARDSDPIRVVELPGSSVRIGRASYCEVRLTEPDLADEECRLRRRGGTWQLVPSRAAGFVWIDGRSVETTCPLPFDVPFRVGEHWLTLRPTGAATPEWRAYKSPAPTASTVAREEIRPAVAPLRSRDDTTDLFDFTSSPPRPTPSPAPEYDHVSRWKERDEKRAKRASLTPEERRWENRWRAAGERVRMRPPVATPPIPSPASPVMPPNPPSASPPDESKLRRVSQDAAELRNRARRDTAPIDRRPAIPEVPASVPSVPPLTTPPVEISHPRVPSYQAPQIPQVDLFPLESRSAGSPAPDVQFDPGLEVSEPLQIDPLTPLNPSFEEPAEESVGVSDAITSWAETDWTETPTEPDNGPDSLVALEPSDATLEASDAIGLSAEAADPAPSDLSILSTEVTENLEASFAEIEDVAAPTPILPTDVATVVEALVEVESLEAADSITAQPPIEPAPPLEASIVEDPIVEDSVPAAEAIASQPVPPQSEPIEAVTASIAPGFGVEPLSDSTVIEPTPAVSTPLASDALPDFQAAAMPAESAAPTFERSHVDFTTTVHDACDNPSAPGATFVGPTIETAHCEEPPRAAAQSASLPPLTDWTAPFDTAAGADKGPTAKEAVPPPSSRDWPTVRDILASHHANVRRAATPRPMVRPALTQPILTEPREPAQWSFPLWLGWPPALLAMLSCGLVCVVLTWIWSVDARWSGAVANLLAGSGATVKPLPATVPLPRGIWWRSSAANLMLWANYFDRRQHEDSLATEEAGKLLTAASQASPIQALVRFALAHRTPVDKEPTSLVPSLGLSRDIDAQSWLGHQFLLQNNKDAAIKAYRRALEMAAQVDLSRVPTPTFDDDTQILRYRLPSEELTSRVIRDMAEQSKWTFADWKEAFPAFAPIPLAAARLLRERGSADSDAALDLVLSHLDDPRLENTSAAVHLAAQAEALAFKLRWADAKTRYQEAIESMRIDPIKRSWWMNLAEIERRLNDDSGRQLALELARGNNANDEISQRAVELIRFSGSRSDKVSAQR